MNTITLPNKRWWIGRTFRRLASRTGKNVALFAEV